MNAGETSVRIRTSNLSWREVDGEIVALDLASSLYFTTNRTGTFLWLRLVDGIDRESLAKHLAAEFELEDHVATRDTEAFLQLLSSNGLLADGS